jgi:hypothetical protein
VYALGLNWPPIRSDGFSYYIYLPAWLIHHDPSLETTALDCCAGTIPNWSTIFRWPATGRWVNPHPIGEALLIAPFFFAADGLTRWTNLSRDGFSLYYQHAAGLAAIAYFAAGLAFLRRILLRYFSPGVSLATLISVVWGTNLFHYATYDTIFSHSFAFFLLAAFLDIGIRWLEAPTYRQAIVVGLLAGLIILVRHTNGLMLLFLVLYPLAGKHARIRWDQVCVAGLVMTALLLPQLWLYRYATGEWVFSTYGPHGRFDFSSPKILPVLVSTQKGLLFWSPILLLALAGIPLLRRHVPGLFVPTVMVLAATLLIIASWSDWQLGGGYGHRGFTDLMPIFALSMAAFYEWARQKRRLLVPVSVFAGAGIALSTAQMIQYWMGIIPFSNTSWDLYRSVFLRFTR